MAKALTEKQVELLRQLNGSKGRFATTIHEKKAYEKAEALGFAESELKQRSAVVQGDGRTLRRFERAYRLTVTGTMFLEKN
jgi:hypothetical protein